MRKVVETLEGYSFGVALLQSADDGTSARLVFLDDPSNPTHELVIPLTPEGRRNMISQLTGGVIING